MDAQRNLVHLATGKRKMKTLTAIVLMFGLVASGAAPADAHGRKASAKKYTYYSAKTVRPQVRGYISRGGGYANEYDFARPLYQGIYGKNTYSSDLTFWERVNSPSGF
jgi:hypothetical protein